MNIKILLNSFRHFALALTLQGIAVYAWPAGKHSNEIEYQIKANYLYKFAGYVEWPAHSFAQSDAPVTVAILAGDAIAEALGKMEGLRSASGRAVVVKTLKSGDALAESLRGVQILFIGRRQAGMIKKLLESIQTAGVLIVTESVGALSVGSMINFVPVDEHIRFEISVPHAERSGLKISARLLAVAKKIEIRRP